MSPMARNRPAAICLALAAVLAISGCSLIPRHEVDISGKFRENPVTSVCIPALFMTENLDRVWPEDFAEMLPENRDRSSAILRGLLESSLSASVAVDSACASDGRTMEWARAISRNLFAERVPLSVPVLENGPQSVLVVSVIRYGVEKDQLHIRLFPFLPWTKKHYVGEPKFDHVCDLSALLVRPSDGAVLFSVREQQILRSGKPDQELLAQVTKNAAGVVAGTFTPRKEE